MARPKKDNADYFSHDSDMRNDPKIKALRRKFGFTGYAIYNFMLEILTDSDFFVHEWNDLSIELLAGDFDIMPEELKEIIKYCSETLHLFQIEDNFIRCLTLENRFESLLSKRKRQRNEVIDVENPQSKVKYSKVKYSKVDESKKEKKTFTSASEIMILLNSISYDRIEEMKELTLFSGDLPALKQKFSVEFVSRYGLNKTEKEVLEAFQSWMHKDKNYGQKETKTGFQNIKTNNAGSKESKIPSNNLSTEWSK